MTTDTTAAETKTFEADVARLLHLMVHSVYSDRDVFLRELISNAADACEKLRYEAISHPELLGDDPKLHITITLSREESSAWTGPRGHVTKGLLQGAVPDLPRRRVHLCGPPPMMDAVKAALAEAGVPAEQVKMELFLSPDPHRIPAPHGKAGRPRIRFKIDAAEVSGGVQRWSGRTDARHLADDPAHLGPQVRTGADRPRKRYAASLQQPGPGAVAAHAPPHSGRRGAGRGRPPRVDGAARTSRLG